MKTIGIIAEFNPFHNGHRYIIDECKKSLGADRCVVIMSGDFVQRGAPALTDKFTRAEMALTQGADLVLELPIYYSLGSAEFFAKGAVSILNGLGCIDSLCFGSECGDITLLKEIANVIKKEPPAYKDALKAALKEGASFPLARQKALAAFMGGTADLDELLSGPNNILGLEYIKALDELGSKISPFTIKRKGSYHEDELSENAGAKALRNHLLNDPEGFEDLKELMSKECLEMLQNYSQSFGNIDLFTDLMGYKLFLESSKGYSEYLDVSPDLSDRIVSNLDGYKTLTDFIDKLKTKNYTYTRISRALFHILLNIRKDKSEEYKAAANAPFARILGLKKESADLLGLIHEKSTIPVIDRLKKAKEVLPHTQYSLFETTINASRIYNLVCGTGASSEYSRKPLVI